MLPLNHVDQISIIIMYAPDTTVQKHLIFSCHFLYSWGHLLSGVGESRAQKAPRGALAGLRVLKSRRVKQLLLGLGGRRAHDELEVNSGRTPLRGQGERSPGSQSTLTVS